MGECRREGGCFVHGGEVHKEPDTLREGHESCIASGLMDDAWADSEASQCGCRLYGHRGFARILMQGYLSIDMNIRVCWRETVCLLMLFCMSIDVIQCVC